MDTVNQDARPKWVRWIDKTLGQHHELPDPMAYDWTKDRLTTQTNTRFGFTDRIRILLSGRIQTRVVTQMDVEVGKAVSESSVIVKPPFVG